MSKKLLALLMGCVIALCLGLVGCGGSGAGGGAAEKEDVTGVWDIQNMDELLGAAMGDTGIEFTDEMKASLGDIVKKICFLELKEDGTFALVAMSDAVEGTYKVEGDTITLDAENSPAVGKLANGTITLEDSASGMKMVFEKSADKTRTVPTEEELQKEFTNLAMQMMGAAA